MATKLARIRTPARRKGAVAGRGRWSLFPGKRVKMTVKLRGDTHDAAEARADELSHEYGRHVTVSDAVEFCIRRVNGLPLDLVKG